MNPGFPGGMPAGNANANANAGMARIQHFVFQNLRNQQVPHGWQSTIPPQQRTMTILQFVTNARLANQNSSVDDIVRSSIQFETERFMRSPTKEHYLTTMRQRLEQFKQVRERNAAQQLQRPGGMPQNMGGMQMMQNGMGNMMQGGQMPQGVPFQMGQMQPNSMPMQPSNSMGGDANNMTNGFNQQRTPQPQPQQQPQQQQQQPQQPQQPQGQPQAQPGAQAGNMPQNLDMQRINMFAQRLAASATQQQREMANAQINALTIHQRQELQAKGVEPHIWFWRQQAIKLLQSRQKNAANQNQMAQLGQNQAGPGMMMSGGNQEMQNQQMANQGFQGSAPGGPNYDFSTFAEQQQGAMRLQDAGQDVVPASNNMGQPMGLNGMQPGQQGIGAQTPNMAQRQQPGMTPQQMAQRQQSLQAQAHARAQAAQANQSPAQQFQMRQQSGLNMTPNQGGSPAMSMLNRAMPPPGQPPNGTAQPPRPPSGPPNGTPQPGMAGQPQVQQNQLGQQMHQGPAGTPNQSHPPGLPQGFPPHMPEHLKQQLLRHPEQNRSAILQNWLRQHPVPANLAGQAGAQFNMGGQPGQALSQQNNQAKQGNPLLNGANPDFQQLMRQNQGQPGQAPMNQQQLLIQQQMRQKQLLSQQNQAPIPPHILRQLDERQYPPQIIQQHIRANLPQDVRTWGQLKTWSSTNPSLAFDLTPDKIVAMQRMQLNELANRRNQQQNMMGQIGQIPGKIPGAPTPGQPNGQPVQNQIPGMTPGMGQRMNGMPLMPGMPQIPQPTAQEIQSIRSSRPGLANMSDDRIREQIMMHRANLIRQQQGQQQGQPQGQPGMPQFPGAQQPRPGGQIPPQAMMNQPGNMPLNQQRQQPGAQPQPQPQAQPNAQPGRAPQPVKTPQLNQTPAATPKTQQKKVKRSHDDFQEAPKPPQPSPRNESAQSGQLQNQQPSNFTQEQLSKMPPAQRNKILAQQSQNAIRNQDQNKSTAPEDKETTTSLQPRIPQEKAQQLAKQYYQEMQANLPNHPQQVDANQRKEMAVKVKHALNWLPKIGPALMHCLSYDNNEDKVKQTIRAHLLIQRNINKQASDLNPTLTITPETLDASINKLNTFLAETTRMMRTRAAAQQAQSQSQSQQGAGGPPLNAQNLQNLQQQTQQLRQQQQHRRTSSQQRNQVPSAPTSSKPPMQLGSPHGVPQYGASTPKMDPNNLHIPPNKKQKVGGSKLASDPKAGKEAGASPKTAKTSPPQKRPPTDAAAKAAAKPQPAFTCPQQSCDFSITGFKTKKELEEHQQKSHQTPEDVFGFVEDGFADSLGLNQDGTSKVPKPEPVAANRGVKMATSQRPQSLQTKTGIKQEVSTPASAAMGRVPTQTGPKSSPSANVLKTPQATIKTQTPTSGAQMGRTPSKAPKESAAEKPSAPAPTVPGQPELQNNAWADSDISPQTLDQLMDGFIDDLNLPPVTLSNAFDLTNATAASLGLPDESWAGPRSTTPATTPSSSKTESRESDIGENDNLKIDLQWDAARWADTSDMLPVDASLAVDLQGLGVSLGMDPNIANQSMDDIMMAGLDVDASKADWNWDTLFGEKAGLENDLKDGFPVADTNQLDSLFAL